jgi:hypothetical protein
VIEKSIYELARHTTDAVAVFNFVVLLTSSRLLRKLGVFILLQNCLLRWLRLLALTSVCPTLLKLWEFDYLVSYPTTQASCSTRFNRT